VPKVGAGSAFGLLDSAGEVDESDLTNVFALEGVLRLPTAFDVLLDTDDKVIPH